MKVKKEDWNYAAGVATGMSRGSDKPIKLKKKYKFKADVASMSGLCRSYYEENQVEENTTVASMLNLLLEEVEKAKKEAKPVEMEEEKPDTKLLEDYKLIKFISQKGINEVANGHNNKALMNDILDLVRRYEGDTSLGEGAAETSFTNTSMDSYHQEELEDGGKNNPTE